MSQIAISLQLGVPAMTAVISSDPAANTPAQPQPSIHMMTCSRRSRCLYLATTVSVLTFTHAEICASKTVSRVVLDDPFAPTPTTTFYYQCLAELHTPTTCVSSLPQSAAYIEYGTDPADSSPQTHISRAVPWCTATTTPKADVGLDVSPPGPTLLMASNSSVQSVHEAAQSAAQTCPPLTESLSRTVWSSFATTTVALGALVLVLTAIGNWKEHRRLAKLGEEALPAMQAMWLRHEDDLRMVWLKEKTIVYPKRDGVRPGDEQVGDLGHVRCPSCAGLREDWSSKGSGARVEKM